jgi:hypothetical protein
VSERSFADADSRGSLRSNPVREPPVQPGKPARPTTTMRLAYIPTHQRPTSPHNKRHGKDPSQRYCHTEHRRVRARVEHIFAPMKSWKFLRDCRRQGDSLRHAVQAVATCTTSP